MIAAPGCRPATSGAPDTSQDRYAAGHVEPSPDRRIVTAELLSIGSELTVGETRDTNAGELARS